LSADRSACWQRLDADWIDSLSWKLIAHTAADRREEETIKERSNKIQTLNYYAEKIEEPRLLQTGRKDTQKDDQQLKLKNGAI
jgi:hypothetical protein